MNYKKHIADTIDSYKLNYSEQIDHVSEYYRIVLNEPLDDYDNSYSKCFNVENIKDSKDNNLYAAILDKSFNVNIPLINHLKSNQIEGLVCPIEAEIVKLSSNQQNIVLIFNKKSGVSLREYIENKGNLSVNNIIKNIVFPIANIIEKLSIYNITYGKINPDNIFIRENGSIFLSEFITEYCGYSQKNFYETIERIECPGFCKGNGDNSVDYYALGALCVFLYYGARIDSSEDNEISIERKLEYGSYKIFIDNNILPNTLVGLLKGLTIDKSKDRWRLKQITEWYHLQKYPIINENNVEATKPLLFNEKRYLNSKHLAYGFYKNWDAAKIFIKEDKLIKWIERDLNNPYIAESLNNVMKNTSIFSQNKDDYDNILVKVIIILDPTGPIRFKNFAIYLDSIINLINIGIKSSNQQYLSYANRILNMKLWRGIIDTQRYEKKSQINNLLSSLDDCKNYISIKSNGYGFDRCLYELDNFLPCQSQIVSNYYINNNNNLIMLLEQLSPKTINNIIDKNIIAFIMCRSNYDHEKIISFLKPHPEFYKNATIFNLSILAFIQKESNIKYLPNLSKAINNDLSVVADLINNNNKKIDWLNKLEKISKSGYIPAMLQHVTNIEYIKEDIAGFKKAIDKYKLLEKQKELLNDLKKIHDVGYRYGLKITVIISYMLFVIVFIFVFIKI